MRWLIPLTLSALVTACYQPKYPEGVLCNADDDGCPPGLVCDPRDKVCRVEPLGGTCGDGEVDTAAGEVCDHGSDACCDDACSGPRASGTVCRASLGSCDVEETCNGSDFACPADVKSDDGSECTDCPAGGAACECSGGMCLDLCGNGAVDVGNGEECDGVDGPCPGQCQTDCTCSAYAPSCQQYLADVPGLPDGAYKIDPHTTGVGIPAFCDMTTDGGGWTGIDPTVAARLAGTQNITLVPLVDSGDGQSSCEVLQGQFQAYYTGATVPHTLVCPFDIPLGFDINTVRVSQEPIHLLQFSPIVGLGQAAEIDDIAVALAPQWPATSFLMPAAQDGAGDIAVGTPLNNTPVLGLGNALGMLTSFADGDVARWTADVTQMTAQENVLRVQISEAGLEDEGFRWESGRIFVRLQ